MEKLFYDPVKLRAFFAGDTVALKLVDELERLRNLAQVGMDSLDEITPGHPAYRDVHVLGGLYAFREMLGLAVK